MVGDDPTQEETQDATALYTKRGKRRPVPD